MSIIKGIIIGILSLVLIGISAAYFSRDFILHKIIEKAEDVASKKDIKLAINNAEFTGLATVAIQDLSAVPLLKDTLLRIHQIDVSIKLWPLLVGRIQPAEMNIEGLLLNIVKKDSVSNIDFLFDNDTTKSTNKKSIDLARIANNVLNQLLYKIPDNLNMRNCVMQVNDNGLWVKSQLLGCKIENNQIDATTLLSQASDTTMIHTVGSIYASKKQMDIRIYGEGKSITIPYINEKYQTVVSFDTLTTAMNDVDYGDDLEITGRWSVSNLLINNSKISPNDVKVSSAAIDCKMVIGKNFLCIDSSSVAYLKNVKLRPYIKYTLAPDKIYELKATMDETPAQDFFDCFPTGLFQNLEGLQVEGGLSYRLNFMLDSTNPDSTIFHSSLTPTNFKILSYGNTNIQKINGAFSYTPYEYGRPMRNIVVGSDNPNYTTYDNISPFMRNAIITSEDGTFMWHKGFNEDAFRNAIVVNYKTGRFKKGASTITMQLVKNIFLNRNKNVTRKLEEALIVWLIENNHLCSKQRMLEVYLNIIEWAPNVYGVGEAARFYFGKSPSQLTLGESIFMASIVPKPKAFKYSFDSSAQLKPHVRYFFKLVSTKMLHRNLATDADTVNLFNSVQLTGVAKKYIIPSDSVPDMDERDEDDEILTIPKAKTTSTGATPPLGGPHYIDGIRVFNSSVGKDNSDGRTANDEERKRRQEERKKKKEEREKEKLEKEKSKKQ